MGAACYAFVTGATSKVPYFVILIEIGSCVLRLRARATSNVPILLRHGSCVLRLCAGVTSRVPILVLAIIGHIIVHISLWGVSTVIMAFGAGY